MQFLDLTASINEVVGHLGGVRPSTESKFAAPPLKIYCSSGSCSVSGVVVKMTSSALDYVAQGK